MTCSWRTGKPISEPTSNTMPGEGAQEETFITRGAPSCASSGCNSSSTKIPGTGFALEHYNPRAKVNSSVSCGRSIAMM